RERREAAEEEARLRVARYRASTQDYYKVLGVPPTARVAQIQAAYEREVQYYQPDSSGETSASATQILALLKTAYEVLSQGRERVAYHRYCWQRLKREREREMRRVRESRGRWGPVPIEEREE
ncbi:hypothetical protein KIPB_013913, partial [Kipferlia bialata]